MDNDYFSDVLVKRTQKGMHFLVCKILTMLINSPLRNVSNRYNVAYTVRSETISPT